MPRRFNTAGPCNPVDHYMIAPAARLPQVRGLIDQKSYFVLHAPRQVGKTTSLLALAEQLTREGAYVATLLSMEVGAPFAADPGAAELAILGDWRDNASFQLPETLRPPPFPEAPPGQRISAALRAWAAAAPRPLAIFLDEIDALRGDALISVLRQLRSGFPRRPTDFPHALALVGLRDVRDYKVAATDDDRLGTASPFNIKAESITLHNFTREEVGALYAQHTAETGQAFLPEAIDRAFELTQGQPWLVNALARQLVEVLVTDRAKPIERAHVNRAREILIERQDTHLDSLTERLREPRIRSIIEPMLAGTAPFAPLPNDDIRFAIDLGLVRLDPSGGLAIANPIYQEIIVRELSLSPRASLPSIKPSWLTPDGRLDATRLLEAFLEFWRCHGEALLRAAPYHEVAPHLVLMAFLHRVVNGGGSIEREYAIGRGRMDLCVRHGSTTLAIELKVWRDGRRDPLEEGLEQLDGYLAGLGLPSGWLVIFDQRSSTPPIAERTRQEPARTPSGRDVSVIRA
ncbi:MAG: ATP-binding protein [Polyangiaceae bacterium]|nr:ATP-binding protein [Polyangiaceae bacterium]NUQ77454.1 ATP-binding protein [Polyangiaceae bacterium]